MVKISNKFVKINNGKKEVVRNNYIMNRYIRNVRDSQIISYNQGEPDYTRLKYANEYKNLARVYIKFDEEIDYSNDELVSPSDYDIYIKSTNSVTTGSSKSANRTYIYNAKIECYSTSGSTKVDIQDYVGKKITSLGFVNDSVSYAVPHELKAYIITTDYDIQIIEGENLIITRSDDFITNMECDGAEFPLHLAYTDEKTKLTRTIGSQTITYYRPVYSRIYSIGYGTQKGKMLNEKKIDENEATARAVSGTKEYIEIQPFESGDKITLYPSSSLYSSTSIYPVREYQIVEQYLNEVFYPSGNIYPLKSNPKYTIIKYQLFTFDYDGNFVPLDKYYTMNLANDYIGTYRIRLYYERRTN